MEQNKETEKWEVEFDYKMGHIEPLGWGIGGDAMNEEAIKSFIQSLITKTREELLEEIIEDIPLCNDRLSKCNCADHDINSQVYEYLQGLINQNTK